MSAVLEQHLEGVYALTPTRRRRLLTKSEPWRVNPERFETAPAIELYSVLVGNLPLKPNEIVGAGKRQEKASMSHEGTPPPGDPSTLDPAPRDVYAIINAIPITEWYETTRSEATSTTDSVAVSNTPFARRRQLAVTAAMFDRAIPGEDCFTSSVAAVTILPDPASLAASWRKWYASIGAQRRLNYVRHLLSERGVEVRSDERSEYCTCSARRFLRR